ARSTVGTGSGWPAAFRPCATSGGGARACSATRCARPMGPRASRSTSPRTARSWSTRGRAGSVGSWPARWPVPESGRAVLLVIEVGNTNTGVGVYDGTCLLVSWRLTSRREQTADEYGVFIQTLLATRGIERRQITGVAISNVVPTVQQTLEWMCEAYFGVRPFSVQPGVNVAMPLRVDNPGEVGADRICNVVAGVALYGAPLIVVDFGTATNFDVVNAGGEFVGGAIAPGLVVATEALVSRAARLYRVELVRPKEAIG